MEMEMKDWDSRLARIVEIDTTKLVDEEGFFKPNPTITETEGGNLYVWKADGDYEMLVKGGIGIVFNDEEFFLLILNINEVISAHIDFEMFEVIKAQMERVKSTL